MRLNGSFIGSTVSPSATAASGVWTLDEAARYQQAGTWPKAMPALPVASGLKRWFLADYGAKDASGNLITVDNTAVATWQDQSGTADVSQSTSGARPVWRSAANGQNGLPIITFNGTSQFLSGAVTGLSTGASARTTIWCGKYISFNYGGGFGYGTNNTAQDYSLSSNGTTGYGGIRAYGSFDCFSTISITSPFIMAATYDGTTLIYRLNSSTASFTVTLNTGTTGVYIGSLSSASYFAATHHYEDLAYNRVLSSTELDSVFAYLKSRWNTP